MSRGRRPENRNGADAAPLRPGGRIEIAPRAEIDIATDHLGPVLSQRRTVLGLKIEDVAEDIKIRPEYLRALENEALDQLPTPEYGRLFLKSYAQRLGIDVAEAYALLDLCEHPGRIKLVTESVPEAKPKETAVSRRRWSMVWVYTAGAVVTAGLLWILLRGDGSAPDTRETRERTVDSAPPPVTVVETPAETPEPAIGDGPMQLELTFDRETWVVLSADDDTVVSQLLYAGDVARATAFGSFNLTLGHTDGVEATINGRGLVPFRDRAARLSGVLVTADSLRAWLDTAATVSGSGATSQGNDSTEAAP